MKKIIPMHSILMLSGNFVKAKAACNSNRITEPDESPAAWNQVKVTAPESRSPGRRYNAIEIATS